MPVKLHEGRATENDLQACLRLIELAPNDNAKRPFALLVAQYHRIALQKPERTLAMMMPMLTGKRSDSFDFDKLPPLKDWTINEHTALFAVEAAHCLAVLDKTQRAIEIIDTIGQKYEDETRVLAAECGADLFVRTKMYEKSVEFYGFALNVLEILKQREYGPGKGERIFFNEEQQVIRNRLAEKHTLAQRLLDEERFGPDWVAYRDAQRLHFDDRYLEAYFAYMNVVDQYRNSVYGEAATCYLIEILCKMADRENMKDAAETFKNKQEELQMARLLVKYTEQSNAPEALMEKRRENVTNLEKMISLWRSIPLAENAILAAEKYTEQFIEREPFGLYRGEAMLNCGLCRLEIFLDPDKSEPWLLRANKWFDEVKKTDAALLKLEVPDKSKAVSQPPREERFTDEWTNVRLSKPSPGTLFNRRECKWYLSSKHKDALLWLGLIAYAKKDYVAAKSRWNILYEIDPHFKEMDKGLFDSVVKRLMWNITNNDGALFATSAEMKPFKDTRVRLALLIADLEMEKQAYPEAERKFRRLLQNKSIASTRDQAAYCNFALGIALVYQFKTEEGMKLFAQFGPQGVFRDSPSAPRAVLAYADNRAQSRYNPEGVKEGLVYYRYLIERFPKTEQAERAMFNIGRKYELMGEEQTALTAMKAYIKKYPSGMYSRYANNFISKMKGESSP